MRLNRYSVEIILLLLYYGFFSFGFIVVGDIDKHFDLVSRYIGIFIASIYLGLLILGNIKNKTLQSFAFYIAIAAGILSLLLFGQGLKEESLLLMGIHLVTLIICYDIAMYFKRHQK